MSPRVTAILVVHDGARDAAHLRATLDALAASTRAPDHVIAVTVASPAPVTAMLQASAVDQILALRDRVSYGAAVASAIAALPDTGAVDGQREAYWLLAQDTVPAPDALAQLVGALELSPSVGVVGPKLLDGEARDTLVSLGETMTQYGATVGLVGTELDQGQYDTDSDVLAVAPAGTLVRRGTWEAVGGFDPALDRADDGLDFGTRVRLSGYRVSVVPAARVYWYGDGVAGAARSRRGAVLRRQAGAARFGQLYRRLVYARPPVAVLQWLAILPLTLVRIVWRLITKQPEYIAPEAAASLRAFASIARVRRARARLRTHRTAPWAAIRDLRMPTSEVRRRTRLRKEAGALQYEVERSDLNFIGGGGGWLVIGSLLLSLVLFFGLLGASAVSGGGLLPLSDTVGALWSNAVYGWHDLGAGFFGASDPYSAVLAVLGTLTFWNPSLALVLLYILALPLATLGGWFAATRLTERSGYRLVFAVLWTLAPTLLGSLAAGEPAGIIVHLLLPWFAYSVAVYRRSWASTGVASILLAAILACAPSLALPAAIIWLVLAVTGGRMFPRTLWLIIPTLALFAPLIWHQGIVAGNWWALLADPGAAVFTESSTLGWRIALGIPAFDASGWPAAIEALGLTGITADWLLPILLGPLAVIALASLFLRGTVRALTMLAVALLGLVSAVAAAQLAVTFTGTQALTLWPGPGMSLYWLGLVGAAVIGLDSMRRAGIVPAVVLVVASTLVAVPMLATFLNGSALVTASDGRTMPALVVATASSDPGVGTLVIRPENEQAVSASIVRGSGVTLDGGSTIDATRTATGDGDRALATLTGNLVATSGLDPSELLNDFGIQFVLITEPVRSIDPAARAGAAAAASQAATALDANPVLSRVGETDRGVLWRYEIAGTDAAAPATSWQTPVNALVLIIVFTIALLLSVPTEASRRISEASPRTVGQTRLRTGSGRKSGRRAARPGDRQSRRAQQQAERAATAEADQAVGEALGGSHAAPRAFEPEPEEAVEDAQAPALLKPADPDTAVPGSATPEQISEAVLAADSIVTPAQVQETLDVTEPVADVAADAVTDAAPAADDADEADSVTEAEPVAAVADVAAEPDDTEDTAHTAPTTAPDGIAPAGPDSDGPASPTAAPGKE